MIGNLKAKKSATAEHKENALMIFVSPFVQEDYVKALALKGTHQVENLALVITAINYLFPQIEKETLIKGLAKVKHPCRFEYVESKNMIVDASHNPNGIKALRNNLDLYYPKESRRFIFGALKTKNYTKMMEILFREGDEIYLNGFDYPNACTYDELKQACPYEAKAYTKDLIINNDKLNIICGSFYMIGQMDICKNL